MGDLGSYGRVKYAERMKIGKGKIRQDETIDRTD